ncbi:hypothetical protein O181_089778 [Austropuccinia psidii MF-1]|uniref:Peptidase A2 domain-containing protein n=1 Tax=Austropuccinia psidii MF-1 TaxID=1389203 RepID=A0A9Q3IU50_9BASI|nr:hypothetical protein [Austropuccinia psidii MF-1]
MNLRGIGGHKKASIGLAEFEQLILPSGEEKEVQYLIDKGAVYTVLGRPLEENNIRLYFSHKIGEISSYEEADGRRLCLPICKPHMLGWQAGPPREVEFC